MILWVDAQISPKIADWIKQNLSIQAIHVRDLGLREAEDPEIFFAAKEKSATVMTKDGDFLILLDKFGTPPQVIWITCGNTSNARLKEILQNTLLQAVALLGTGEQFVEISDIW
jgi:predicted nuclease of predicted toxin-antitoxin system